jgi:hypothetical protein
MDELLQLRDYIEHGRYADAINLIGELEEMSRDDKIHKIESYLQVLLIHLVKRHAEQRSTRSWDVSVRNAVDAIRRTNKRRKAGGDYLDEGELAQAIDDIYPSALRQASLEAFEGVKDELQLAGLVPEIELKRKALQLVTEIFA